MSAPPIAQSLESIRHELETLEQQLLSPYASKSAQSRGRKEPEPPCAIRTEFQRDRDRILHSKAFRRLKHKTQVFISPAGDHTRTRLTHTLEVAQIARTIARALKLNEDLTEAIALGHDLGHPPFGHAGEEVLNALAPGGFEHTAQSVRIVQHIEALNLTRETLDGIRQQRKGEKPDSLEGQVVELADRLAYLHHDVEDAVRAGLIDEAAIPADIQAVLGATRQARLDTLIANVITISRGKASIQLSQSVYEAMFALRGWMFEHVYRAPAQQEQHHRVRRVLTELVGFYRAHPERMSPDYLHLAEQGPAEEARAVIDYIAGMTDRFALETYQSLCLPNTTAGPP